MGLIPEGGWFTVWGLGIGLVVIFLGYRFYADSWFFFRQGMIRRGGQRLKVLNYQELAQIEADYRQVVRLYFGVLPSQGPRKADYKVIFAPHVREQPLFLSDPTLGEFLEKAVMQFHLPLILEDYRSGQEIRFGKLVISKEAGFAATGRGIRGKGIENIAWANLKHIEIKRGYLNVYDKVQSKPRFDQACRQIPNFQTMMVFLVQQLGVQLVQE